MQSSLWFETIFNWKWSSKFQIDYFKVLEEIVNFLLNIHHDIFKRTPGNKFGIRNSHFNCNANNSIRSVEKMASFLVGNCMKSSSTFQSFFEEKSWNIRTMTDRFFYYNSGFWSNFLRCICIKCDRCCVIVYSFFHWKNVWYLILFPFLC